MEASNPFTDESSNGKYNIHVRSKGIIAAALHPLIPFSGHRPDNNIATGSPHSSFNNDDNDYNKIIIIMRVESFNAERQDEKKNINNNNKSII